MIKRYKSKMSSLRVLAKVDGKVVPVEFKWDYIYKNSGMRGCSFTTDDVALQKALEQHKYYNSALQPSFWTDDVEPVEEAPAETPVETVTEEPKEKKVKRYSPKK